jgi:hypothetical protein
MTTWEHFEHGADVGVRGRGDTPARAFEEAARALFSLLCADLAPFAGGRRQDGRKENCDGTLHRGSFPPAVPAAVVASLRDISVIPERVGVRHEVPALRLSLSSQANVLAETVAANDPIESTSGGGFLLK